MFDKFVRKQTERLFRGGLKDRIFLQAGLARANSFGELDTLFVGSSYAVYGIISDFWSYSLNLGGISQDFYYAKKIIENIHSKTKRVVIICGYYTPYIDLSSQKKERENLVGSVYWPVFRDSHNWNDPSDNAHWHKQYRYPVWLRRICERKLYQYFYRSNAWFDDVVRRKGDFSLLPDELRENLVVERTNVHNKHLKYKASFEENKDIVKCIKEITDKRGMELFIVIPPFTREYLDRIDARYIKDSDTFYRVTNTYDGYIDCNKIVGYTNDFFVDADHLNDKGAAQFTKDLKWILNDRLS